MKRATAREDAIAALRGKSITSPAKLVDAAFTCNRSPDSGRNPQAVQGHAVDFPEPEPWPEPVAGDELLNGLASTFTRYLALPAHAADAKALWVTHAHALDAAFVTPTLTLASPEERCGKTTALHLLNFLVPRPLLSSNISTASVFRVVERFTPTLLVDEADTVLHLNDELRGILNSSHTRAAAYVVRTVDDDHEPRRFSTWTAKVIALIGDLPETLAYRSIIIPMRRRAQGEHIESLRLDKPGDLDIHRRRAARWAVDHLDDLRAADPDIPTGLNDRAADN